MHGESGSISRKKLITAPTNDALLHSPGHGEVRSIAIVEDLMNSNEKDKIVQNSSRNNIQPV